MKKSDQLQEAARRIGQLLAAEEDKIVRLKKEITSDPPLTEASIRRQCLRQVLALCAEVSGNVQP